MQRAGTGSPDGPWDDDAWQARVRSNVSDPKRVAAVAATGLFDSTPDDSFDQLARLASAVLGVPWVFVTVVDEERSFWVSAVGVDPDPGSGLYGENPLGDSFCQYEIAADGPVVISDARVDERSRRNSSIESMGVIAWAGFPLRSSDGHVVGTFCAVDRVPREWSGGGHHLAPRVGDRSDEPLAAAHRPSRRERVSARAA